MIDEIKGQLTAHIDLINLVTQQLAEPIASSAETIAAALKKGRKLLLMGNGGSAADAQHFAAEMVGRFRLERRALPAIALTTDSSILTAIGNDYGFDLIFERQVEALINPGDILIGISTSGNSLNVKRALETGKNLGALTMGLLGCGGGEIGSIVDLELTVPSAETPRIQEVHLLVIHIICDLVEKTMFSTAVE